MASNKQKPKQKPARKKTVTPAPAARAGVAWVVAAVLVLLTLAVFSGVRSHDFVDFDDGLYLVDNPHVREGLTARNIQWAATTGHAANWHPVTWISHQIDVSFFGMDAGMHHVTSVAWHVLNTLVLFGWLRSMTGALWRSACVAALFAVHPAHVESVAWLSERKDVISTFFWLATTWSWVIWARRPAAKWLALALVMFAFGLMAKPMLVTLPFTLLLLDVWPLGRTSIPAVTLTRRVMEKMPFLAMALASSVVTFIVQQRGGAVGRLDMLPMGDRLANAAVAYGTYLQHLIWPANLAVFYPYARTIPAGAVALAAGALVALSLFAWAVRRAHPYVIVGWLWFLGTMVPVIGLVQIGTQALADRYTYVPYVGLFVAVAWGAHAAAGGLRLSPRAPLLLGAAVVVLLAVAAHAQTETWQNSETLWRHTVAVTRDNAMAHNKLGVIYGNSGRVKDAVFHFKEALRLRPDMTEATHILPNLGRALVAQGQAAEAIPYLERARPLNPGRADIQSELAFAYLATDRPADAIAAWREAVRIDPRFEDAWFAMGIALAAGGQFGEARRAFGEVVRINPGRTDAQQALARLR